MKLPRDLETWNRVPICLDLKISKGNMDYITYCITEVDNGGSVDSYYE